MLVDETIEDLKTKKYMIFDMDGTFADTPKGAGYENSEPIENMVKLINYFYDKGFRIIIETGRGATLDTDFEPLTRKQLKEWGVKYHKLYMVKKPRKYLRIDDGSIDPQECIDRFLDGDEFLKGRII